MLYPFETCIFTQVWLMANSGSEVALNFVLMVWISQLCPNSSCFQLITKARYLVFHYDIQILRLIKFQPIKYKAAILYRKIKKTLHFLNLTLISFTHPLSAVSAFRHIRIRWDGKPAFKKSVRNFRFAQIFCLIFCIKLLLEFYIGLFCTLTNTTLCYNFFLKKFAQKINLI